MVLAFLLLLLLETAVLAHSDLVTASPAPGTTISGGVTEIRLVFSEAVSPQSSILLFDHNFQLIELDTVADPTTPNAIYAPINPSLTDGDYTVQWTAVSPDGHEITGSYQFGVRTNPFWRYQTLFLFVLFCLPVLIVLWRVRGETGG